MLPSVLRAENPANVLVADFSSGAKKGRLGDGGMGVWQLDARDPEQGCEIATHKDENGNFSLRFQAQKFTKSVCKRWNCVI